MTWYYKDKEFTEEDINNCIGFVYLITNLLTNKKYIGKKLFTFSYKKTAKGKRPKKIRKESDWKNYFGSSIVLQNEVKELGSKNFKREILHLCKTKGECNYLELKEQIVRDVLLREDYYNEFVGAKIHGSHVKGLKIV